MDPLTALTVAYGAIKTGVKVGKDIQALASDIGSLWDSIDQIRDKAEQAKKNPKNKTKSINSEAMDIFMAEAKAIQIENELREFFTYEYSGPMSWPDMIRIRNDVRKQRREAAQQEAKRKRKLRNQIIMGVAILSATSVVVLAAGLFFYFIVNYNR